jgi:hypothetical protein
MFLNSILFEVAKYAERKEFGMISVDENDKRDKISITFNQKKLFLYRNRSQLFTKNFIVKRTYANFNQEYRIIPEKNCLEKVNYYNIYLGQHTVPFYNSPRI